MNATLPFFLRDVWLAPLFPLATAVLMLVAGRRIANRAIGYLCCGSLLSSFLFSCGAFLELIARPVGGRLVVLTLFEWFPAIPFHGAGGVLGSFSANWEFQVDPLSALMLLIVTGVGFLIHVYSIGYMEREGGLYRYFGVMNLFVFSMLTLVLAGNLAMLFVGWEGVGACSYLLIGFHFHKRAAADAGKKAFVVNRVCDAAFLLGIFLASATLGTMRFEEIWACAGSGTFRARQRGDHGNRVADFCGRGGQVGANPALHLAAGRDGRADAGKRADSRGDHGHCGRLHRRADESQFFYSLRRHWQSSRWWARSRRCLPRRWRWYRRTSRRSWRIRRSHSLATCS